MYNDLNVPVTCHECGMELEGLNEVKNHLLNVHLNYTPEEVENFAQIWLNDAYEQLELEELENSEYFKMNGEDTSGDDPL